MNISHRVAHNIALKKAGLGFVVDRRRTPLADTAREYDAPVLQLKAKRGRTEAGECKISRRR